MENNEYFNDNIFGNEENFIEDIKFKQINQFLLNLKNGNNLNNILMIIHNKIQSSEIICHILNSEKLKNNKLILILFEFFFEGNKNDENEIIKKIIKILLDKIIISREYIYFICQKIRILDEKNEINELFILKCLDIFKIIFSKKISNNNEDYKEISKKNIKNHYFYFLKLNEGLKYENVSNFPLNNSYLYINFKRESNKDFYIIQIKISQLITLNISIKNNLLYININEAQNFVKESIEIETNKYYNLKIHFLIENINSISSECFQIELNKINKKKTSKKKEEEIKKEKTQNLDMIILKDFIGIIKSFYLSRKELDSNDSIFDIKNNNLDYCLIISPLCYKNQILKEPINEKENKIEDDFFNNSIFKQDNITFDESMEILLILFEIISLNKFKIAAPILLEIICKMINKHKKKKMYQINIYF